jgi:hypothetical protein
VHAWNNVSNVGVSNSGQLADLVNALGEPTSIGLVMLSRFNGANENGTTASSVFPGNATRDSLFGNTETFSGLSNVFPSFKLTGLHPARRYDFLFYASRLGVGDNRETGYTVTGGTAGFAALNAAANVNTTAAVTGITPTPAGEIGISLAPTPANNNANHFTYLGAMRVREVEPLEFLPPVVSNGQLRLDWTGQGILEWSTTLADPWTPVPAATPPHVEEIGGTERKFFRLRAVE